MAEEKQQKHFCNVNEDGICGMHEVEVERRNVDRNRLNDLRVDFKDFKSVVMGHIGNLCTFKNRLLGVSVLGTMVVLGNYAWTGVVNKGLHEELKGLHGEIQRLRDDNNNRIAAILLQVSNNRTEMAVVASQIATTNDRLREVITLIEKNRSDLRSGNMRP